MKRIMIDLNDTISYWSGITYSSRIEYTQSNCSLPNKISRASEGVMTLSGRHSFSLLSPDKILQSNLRDKATYGTSLICGDICLASSTLSLNVSSGTNSISFLIKENIFINSSFENFVNLRILSTLLPISKNRNSGPTNSNFIRSLFNSKTLNGLPLIISAENTVLASTTNSIKNHFLSNLLAIARLTSSESSLAFSSLSLDLDTIDSTSFISSNSLFKNLRNNNCNCSDGILPNSFSISSGILTTNSAMIINNYIHRGYLNSFIIGDNDFAYTRNTIAFNLTDIDSSTLQDYDTKLLRLEVNYTDDSEGKTTYQFSNTTDNKHGLQSMLKPWIVLMNYQANDQPLFITTSRKTLSAIPLKVTADENEKITKLTFNQSFSSNTNLTLAFGYLGTVNTRGDTG